MPDWVEVARVFGIPSMALLFLLYAGHKRWYVFGWAFLEMEKDRNFWRDAALRSMGVAEKVVKKKRGSG